MERVLSILTGAAIEIPEQGGINKFSGRMMCALGLKQKKNAKGAVCNKSVVYICKFLYMVL